MKNLLLLGILFFCTSLQAQKLSYKKGIISVDKVKKYKVDRTKKGGLKALSNYALRTIEGEDLLIITDTVFYLTRLPNETGSRNWLYAHIVSAPSLNKRTIVPMFGSLKFGKNLMQSLDKVNFFNQATLTEEIYERYISLLNTDKILEELKELESMNVLRVKNYQLTKNAFGPLLERKPGIVTVTVRELKISEGWVDLAILKLEEGTTTYKLINPEGAIIGEYIIQSQMRKSSVRMMIDEGNWEEKTKEFSHGISNFSLLQFKDMATYLVNAGYL